MTAPAPERTHPRPARGLVSRGASGRWAVHVDRWGVSARLRVRAVLAVSVLAVLVLGLAATGLFVGGASDLPADDVLRVIVGGGGDFATVFLVQEVRMPRVFTGLLAGMCLGASGMVFQSAGRNPLASPDVIGFTAGASAGAAAQILVFGGGTRAVAGGALAGGLLTGLAVYALTRRDGLAGNRLVVVGVALAAMLTAATSYLLARAKVTDVAPTAEWLAGSLNGRGWDHVATAGAAAALLLPLLAVLGPALRLLELGDDVARGLGVPVERVRLAALFAGVGLASGAVAAAGPIAFVALAAPQIAARFTRSGLSLWASALTGAVLLLGADILTQQLFPGAKLPVGVVTAALGGCYLAAVIGLHRKTA
ncbi:FecCD family ABC transporter permease [Yinghuangia soli]|uniref:Iron chelate uptake ABC transporter family permease subunit n=1 Tax=Yinghuangia soli TaxID=2908204 RepID=A0AA41U507_9ACTN|nr:iron chelate uptake ABC transporter family permease subunit [Yinghuangia soli]MCF2533536.1 iron chelate uptake ABC transporter family permease subunit [Yinghuangia soli]